MRIRLLGPLIGALVVVAGAGAAYAGPPWVVDAGGRTSGTVHYTAIAPGDSTTPAVNMTMGAADMTCKRFRG